MAATDMEKMEAVLKDPFILLTDMKINSIQDMVPLLEEVMRAQRPLFVVAEDVEGEALSTILLNRLRGTLECQPSRPPASAIAAAHRGHRCGHRCPGHRKRTSA